MSKKNEAGNAVIATASAEALQALDALVPQGDTYNRVQFPKLVFKSQNKFGDKLDKDGNPVLDADGEVEQVQAVKAGSFYIEKPTGETDENGKELWSSELIGKEVKAHIVYHRKRLQMWDADEEVFYSTPIYDDNSELVPLFKQGEFVTEGKPAELQALYPKLQEYTDKKTGEKKTRMGSKLQEASVVYLLVNDELLELTLTGTSMWAFSAYIRKHFFARGITTLNSTKEENGSIKWNKMSFKLEEGLTNDQALLAVQTISELKQGIADEKAFYAKKRAENVTATASYDGLEVGDVPSLEGATEDDSF